MNHRPLGPTSLVSSTLAYGCWRTANSADEATDSHTTRTAVHAAIDAGFTLFDLADIYCEGRSESAFGRVLAETPHLRDKVLIGTKCGIRFAGDGSHRAPYRYDSSPEHIIRSCEESLKRLRVETIDLYQIHRPDWLMNAGDIAAAFDNLQSAGKVRQFGVSNFRPSQVELLQSACNQPLAVNQVEISLLQLSAFTDGTLDQCLMTEMTPLAWSPLAGGMLGEGASRLLPSQESYDAKSTLAELDRISLDHGTTHTAVALAWLLKHPSGIMPIVGSTKPDRIRAAAKAVEVELTREEWYRLLTAARHAPLP